MRATLLFVLGLSAAGCGGDILGGGSFAWVGNSQGHDGEVSTRAPRLRWRQQIAPDYVGAYVPVERAVPALDPVNDRIYVGSSAGQLWALTSQGGRIYSYDAAGGIGAQPALDIRRDEIFVPTEDGVVHALTASSGEVKWRTEVDGAVSSSPVLTDDVVYVATDDDGVVAIARDSGERLWRYQRDTPEGFYISEHAGITLVENRLIAAFTAGVVVSLSPADGALQWERDTSLELDSEDGPPRFPDVDTTPLVIDGEIYIASFAGGLFRLELESGTVLSRDEELTGVIEITQATPRLLLLSSGDLGLVCYDRVSRRHIWRKELPRGAPAPAIVADDVVLFGETQGGFISVALQTGQELGRFEAGHGFSSRATVLHGRGFVMTNGGVLLAFAMPGAR